jgi:hypothetical protein
MADGIRRRGCQEATTIEGAGVEEEWLASGGGGPSGMSTSQRRQRRQGRGGGASHSGRGEAQG